MGEKNKNLKSLLEDIVEFIVVEYECGCANIPEVEREESCYGCQAANLIERIEEVISNLKVL